MSHSLAPGRRLRLGPVSSLWYPRPVLVATLLMTACLGLTWFLLVTGKIQLSPGEVVESLLGGPEASSRAGVLWTVRLPRAVTGFATGACLGLAGLVFQSLSRNALGSPEIIGMVTGAALGAVVGITVFQTSAWATSGAAMLGCAVASFLGYWLSGSGSAMISRMVLIGIGLSAMWNAMSELLLTRTDPNVAVGAQIWLVGSLKSRTWEHALVPTLAFLACLPVVLYCARHLTVLDLGTDMGSQIGLLVPRLTRTMVLAGVVLTGSAIASTGPISFVSLAAPQIARAMAGTRAVPVLTSALTGGALLLFAESLVQMMPEPLRAPVGIATSALGGIYLLIFLLRRSL